MKFDNKEKAFDFLIEEYFKLGFGSMPKSDIDLLFFTVARKYTDLVDKSDYDISKTLKIPQQRVRNLRVREALKYSPVTEDYIESYFLKVVKFAKPDAVSKKISFAVKDPNIYIELENLIEIENGYVEASLNPKEFTIRVDQLLWLLFHFQAKKGNKSLQKIEDEFIKSVAESLKQEEKLMSRIQKESLTVLDIQKAILDGTISSSIDLIVICFPAGSFIFNIFRGIKDKLL